MLSLLEEENTNEELELGSKFFSTGNGNVTNRYEPVQRVTGFFNLRINHPASSDSFHKPGIITRTSSVDYRID